MKNAGLRLRLRAAAWASLVAVVIVGIGTLVVAFGDFDTAVISIIVSAVISAGVSGYIIGWHLLNPEEQHNALNAMLWGWAVAGLAYPIFAVIWAFAEQIRNTILYAQLGIGSPEPGYIILTLIVALLFGPFFSGWYIVPIAGIVAIPISWRYRQKPPSRPRGYPHLRPPPSA